MKNKQIIYYIVAAIAVIGVYALVISPYLNVQRTNIAPEQANAKEVSCDVVIYNPPGIPFTHFGDLTIQSVNCQQQYVSSCARFAIFSSSGQIKLEAQGGIGDSATADVGETSSKSYNLHWCGSRLTKNFNVHLYNENNEEIGLKSVSLP